MDKFIDDEEFEKAMQDAEKAAGEGLYSTIIRFKQPREWEGQTIDKLTFNWDKLTGEDFLAIEQKMGLRNKIVVYADFSTDFILEMAVRCCEEKVDDRFLRKLPIALFNRIRNRARDFLNVAQA